MPVGGAILLIIFAGLLLCLYLFYPRVEGFFIYYPEKPFETVPSDWQLTHEEVYFHTEDHMKLHGWFFPVRGNKPVVLFSHGNAGNISHRLENIRELLRYGIPVFIFDYRGYGKSEGSPSETGLYRDGVAAYDFLIRERHVQAESIVLFGRSLGAAVAVHVARQRKVRSLILESAFTSTRDMAKAIPLFLPFSFLLPARYNNLEKIAGIRVPKLFVHGQNDEIVPLSMGRRLFAAAADPKFFYTVNGAGHNDTFVVGGDAYFQTLAAFVENSGL